MGHPRPELRRHRLANGLEVRLLPVADAATVASALYYRVGAAGEPAALGGLAHFLEHTMFKGSPGYPAGELDRLVQALGGVDNAYTTHDASVYTVQLAADRWQRFLPLEADRMAALTLDPGEVERERQVILEEIAMYEDDPWQQLEEKVFASLYGDHPYGRPVLGRAETVGAISSDDLAALHRDHYGPGNSVLVLAGGLGDSAVDAVEDAFGAVPARAGTATAEAPGAAEAVSGARLRLARGSVPRLLVALPAPPAPSGDTARLRLLAYALSGGRTGLLHHSLVEEGELCHWVSSVVSESVGPGSFTVGCELHRGVDPDQVEAAVLGALGELGRRCLEAAELERARRALEVDWVFAQERVEQRAAAAGLGAALFGDGYAEASLEASLTADPEALREAAREHLRVEGAVIGWSLPGGDEG